MLALLPRLLALDGSLTADEADWMRRTLRFGAALARGDLHGTYQTAHPGVAVMWVSLAGIGPRRLEQLLPASASEHPQLQRVSGYREALDAARRATAVVAALLVALVVALAWRLLGPGPGLIGGLLVLLDPYLVGSSQQLHPDTLLAPLMAIAVLAGLVFWTAGGGRGYLVLSAGAGGLALLAKTPAVALLIYFGLVGLAAARPWRHGPRPLGPILLWGGLVALTYGLLWPAIWVDPPGTAIRLVDDVRALGGQPHGYPNFFLGRVTQDDPGPLFYPLALAFRLSPIVLVGLAALLVSPRARSNRGAALPWLLGYVALFAALMTLGPKKFDRYMLPVILVLDLLAGAGLWLALSGLKPARLAMLALALPVALQLGLLVQAYPYPIAAYNPLLGGAAGAQRVLMVGWGEGLEQAAAYLNQRPGAERLVVSTHYQHVLRPLFRGSTVRLEERDIDYFVVYVNMQQRRLIPRAVERSIAAGPPEFTASVNGVEYAWVYYVGRGRSSAVADGSAERHGMQ